LGTKEQTDSKCGINVTETNVKKTILNTNMKKIVLVFVTVLITVSGFAQKTADIGIWGGTSMYIGDMDDAPPMETFNLNFGGYFRYNFNARVALRAMILTGKFSADGMIEDVPWSYSKSVQDISLQVEINYLKYLLGVKNTPFTSYVMGGLGVAYYPYQLDPALIATFNPGHPMFNSSTPPTQIKESVVATTIPFGIGFKFNMGERWGIGIEYQMRKMFYDKLDDLDDPIAFVDEDGQDHYYTDQWHNNDWSGYLGMHVTYKIYIGKKACPAYDSKQ
jgi:hypothetical protein